MHMDKTLSMTEGEHKQIILNRADLVDAAITNCENCAEPLIFALCDTHGQTFSVGLTTLLQCLKFAAEQGAIPKLPPEWSLSILKRYDC